MKNEGESINKDLIWLVCPICDEREVKMMHEIRFFIINNVPMVDIKCPIVQDDNNNQDKQYCQIETFSLDDYSNYLKKINQKVSKNEKFFCLNGHNELDPLWYKVHQHMIFDHRHLVSKYKLDLQSLCLGKNHGEVQKIVKHYCTICNTLFCKVCAEAHKHKNFVDLKEICKKIKAKKYIQNIQGELGDPNNPICLYFNYLASAYNYSSDGLLPNYYLMRSVLNGYYIKEKKLQTNFPFKEFKGEIQQNAPNMHNTLYQSINYYKAFNPVFGEPIQGIITLPKYKKENKNSCFICVFPNKIIYGDVTNEQLLDEFSDRNANIAYREFTTFYKQIIQIDESRFVGISRNEDDTNYTSLSVLKVNRNNEKMKLSDCVPENQEVELNCICSCKDQKFAVCGEKIILYELKSNNSISTYQILKKKQNDLVYTSIIFFCLQTIKKKEKKSNLTKEGKYFVCGNNKGKITFLSWNDMGKNPIAEIDFNESFVNCLLKVGKNKFVIGWESGNVTYFNKGNYLTKQAHFKGISCMANLPNKKEIITGGKDCKISIIELKFLSVLITYCEHPAELTSISIFQSCLGKNGLITGDKNGNLIFWKNGGDTLETEYLKKFENEMKLPS